MFERIPQELKELKRWIVWRYEDRNGDKPTKIPYCPHLGILASVTNPQTWSAFDEAVTVFEKSPNKYSGIGFNLFRDDGYTFIDLDDCKGNVEAFERQKAIHAAFNSYSEISPSGSGLHIIVKGVVPSGHRRSHIEIYSSERYMTMTGNVFNDKPIEERQELSNILWAELGGDVEQKVYGDESEQTKTDNQILEEALSASNGDKFELLLNGKWNIIYPSQSEADFAFVDIVAYYTQNRSQIKRLFRSSPLGQRDKAKRNDYVNWMITKSFDNQLSPVDFEGVENKFNDYQAEQTAKANPKAAKPLAKVTNGKHVEQPEPDNPIEPEQPAAPASDLPWPEGLVGEIAAFIYEQAPRPVYEIALAGAIGLMAGICGRAYNVSSTGLNMYVLALARTGRGKEAMQSGIDKIMSTVETQVPAVRDFMGPGEIASPQALMKHLSGVSACFLTIIGEYGQALKQMADPRAGPNVVGLKRLLLNLYAKSGKDQTLKEIIYSNKDNNTKIVHSPAFSLLGESNPLTFYQSVDEEMIQDGLLPRFLIFHYNGIRVAYNENHASVKPSPQLIDKVGTLAASCLSLLASNARHEVLFDDEAMQDIKDFDKFCDQKINSADLGVTEELYNRAHLKVLKIAALLAVGINPYAPVITKEQVRWASDLVLKDIEGLINKFDTGEVGAIGGDNRQMSDFIEEIKKFVTLPSDKLKTYGVTEKMYMGRAMPYVFFSRRLIARAAYRHDKLGSTMAIKRVIQSALDSGLIQEVPKNDALKRFDTTGKMYVVKNFAILT